MSATAVILLIRVLAPLYGVDPDLALVICRRESAFDPRAIGDGGAAYGLWQLSLIHISEPTRPY